MITERESLNNFDALAAEMLSDAPCGIAATSAEGRVIYANRTLGGWLEACPCDLADGTRIQDLLTAPSRIFFETHVRPMIRLQGFVREIACELKRENAEPLPVIMNGVTRPARGNYPERVDYTFFDATERAQYERSLRKARAEADQLAAVVRSSPNAILRTDRDGRVEGWNRGAERMFGHSAVEALGQFVHELIPLKDELNWLCDRAQACHHGEGVHFEAEHAGSDMIVEVTIAAIGEAEWRSGRAAYSAILRDVSARARVQRQLSLLVGEMRHRVKNTLAVVSSIARQTFAGPEHAEPATAFQRRLNALARAQDVLGGENSDTARFRAVTELCVEEAGGPDRMHAEGPDILLGGAAASSLAMALHELTTNALKYGALSEPDGQVALTWTLAPDDDTRIELAWQETGGPRVRPPKRRGFGTQMIEMLIAAEFGGKAKFYYRPDGLRLTATMSYDRPAR